jgi:hypothetical protein
MLVKFLREAKEALEEEVDKGDLQTESVFILSQELDSLVVQYLNKDFDEEKSREQNETVVNIMINKFLRQKNLNISDLKYRANIRVRNELIAKIRGEAGLSIRKIAKCLGINRGIVLTGIRKLKQNSGIKN